jgi:hypothetical protein
LPQTKDGCKHPDRRDYQHNVSNHWNSSLPEEMIITPRAPTTPGRIGNAPLTPAKMPSGHGQQAVIEDRLVLVDALAL